MELYDRLLDIRKWDWWDFNKYNPSQEQKDIVAKLYVETTGQTFNESCRECFRDAWIALSFVTKQKLIDMANKLFHLREGALIDTTNSINPNMPRGQWTDANITDEIAVELLANSRGYISSFESYPTEWQKLVSDFKAGKTPKAETPEENTPPTDENPATGAGEDNDPPKVIQSSFTAEELGDGDEALKFTELKEKLAKYPDVYKEEDYDGIRSRKALVEYINGLQE